MYYEQKISATMRERKQMDFVLDLKSVDVQGRFAGYASVFDIVDSQSDIVLRGAFSKTIKNRHHNIKLLWQHQQEEPIGIIEKLFEDERGLYVQARLLTELRRAKEALALLKAGALKGLSIGYSPVHYRYDERSGVRLLSEVDLWEISLVTFPANEAANITVVKHCTSNQELTSLACALERATATLSL